VLGGYSAVSIEVDTADGSAPTPEDAG